MKGWERVGRWYRSLALFAFTATAGLVIINMALHWLVVEPTWRKAPVLDERERAFRFLQFERFTQFRERQLRSVDVNVDENGFRITKDQGVWPPAPQNFNVFLFGSSTAFGYGVSDDETVASHLQDALRESGKKNSRVYNFGRAYYYSTQERILFEQLLLSGSVPDMVVFLDGTGELFDARRSDVFWSWFREVSELGVDLVRRRSDRASVHARRLVEALPMSRILGGLGRGGGEADDAPPSRSPWTRDSADASEKGGLGIEATIQRYLANKKLISAAADAHGVTPVFVVQPVPYYKYVKRPRYSYAARLKEGYVGMERLVKDKGPRPVLWCADIQVGVSGMLYMDKMHYSPEMSKRVAECVVDGLVERQLL